MLGIWIAVLSGALMSIQGVFNTEVTKQSSLWVSTGWVQLSAFFVCVIAWAFYREREYFSAVAGGAQVYAAGRSAGRIYYDYGD